MTEQIIIIGGGIGGLSAAIRLAAAGKRVLILEQNDQVGGKMGQMTLDGFRWDTGPSVITMRHVFEDLFAAAGRDLSDYIDLLPVAPLTRYFYPDGAIIDASSDTVRMIDQIEQIAPHDAEGYLRYLRYAERIHRITGPVFIYDHPPTPASFARVPMNEWLLADPFRTMQQAIAHHVRSPHLQQLLGRFATYVGGSPYAAPATLNVIAHVEMTGGVWYPRGGIYSIAAAMQRLAGELGVEIRTDTPATRIITDGDHITGVALNNGQTIPASTIIANVDVGTVYEKLLPSNKRIKRRRRTLASMDSSCSGFIMLLGVEGDYPALAHHNIFFSTNYAREFNAIFADGVPPEDPTIYVSITSKSDPSHAPPGCENWFILVNAPPLSDRFDWAANAEPYRQLVLRRLAEAGYDIRDKIRVERILTPLDLERLTGAHRGALYGPSPNSKWTAFRRPHNRNPDLRGLYFAGGTTHPGGGVPMVTLSGKVAAEMVLEDLNE